MHVDLEAQVPLPSVRFEFMQWIASAQPAIGCLFSRPQNCELRCMYGLLIGLKVSVMTPYAFSFAISLYAPLSSQTEGRYANGPDATTQSSAADVRTGPKKSSERGDGRVLAVAARVDHEVPVRVRDRGVDRPQALLEHELVRGVRREELAAEVEVPGV